MFPYWTLFDSIDDDDDDSVGDDDGKFVALGEYYGRCTTKPTLPNSITAHWQKKNEIDQQFPTIIRGNFSLHRRYNFPHTKKQILHNNVYFFCVQSEITSHKLKGQTITHLDIFSVTRRSRSDESHLLTN